MFCFMEQTGQLVYLVLYSNPLHNELLPANSCTQISCHVAGYSGSHSPLPNRVSICLRITNFLLWSHGGLLLDRLLSKQDHCSHQLLPPVGSVLAMLAPAQLIPVHLIKLPPVSSLFLGCTSQQETAKFNSSPAAADGKATINLGEMRYSLSIPRGL